MSRVVLTVVLDVAATPAEDPARIATQAIKRALRGITRRKAAGGITNYIVSTEAPHAVQD